MSPLWNSGLSSRSAGSTKKSLLVSYMPLAQSAGHSMMSAPAGKKVQPKKDKSYLARAVAAPKTPTGSGSSPLPSPPTWAPSPQSAAKVIDAARPDAVNLDFDVGDGLPQRGEAAPEETSASPLAREPPAALPVAADQAPSTSSEKRPRADDDDEERKRPKPRRTEAPRPPALAAPSKPLAVATRALATAPVSAALTGGGGRSKRSAPDREIPNGRLTFEPINPYLDGDCRTAYEQYKGSKTTDEFRANGGMADDLVRDFKRGLIKAQPSIRTWLEKLSQQPKKPRTDSQ